LPLDLTIVIPAKNEATNLPGCLAAIGKDLAQKVVVVDSQSSDDTCKIAEEWGATVIPFAWNGRFPKKRNWYLREHTPQTNWVMFLDADEHLTPAFKRDLRKTLATTSHNGFWLSYSIYFLGSELRHGYPLDKLALFRVGAGEYERIDEERWSKLDMEIHEHPQIEGSVGRIASKIDHRDFRSIEHYIAKHNEYSSWEAQRLLQRQQAVSSGKFTFRQRLKYRLITSPLGGVAYFFCAYFLMLGFLDGTRGFVFALLKMSYFTQVYCKLRELKAHDSPKNAATKLAAVRPASGSNPHSKTNTA
jgi:glycosyltransferase involved in cell wall biosynthesis